MRDPTNPKSMGKEKIRIPDVTMEQFKFWLYPLVENQMKKLKPYVTCQDAISKDTYKFYGTLDNYPAEPGFMHLVVEYTWDSYWTDTGKQRQALKEGMLRYTGYAIKAQQLGKNDPRLVVTAEYNNFHATVKKIFFEIWDQIIAEFGEKKSEPEEKAKPAKKVTKPKASRMHIYFLALKAFIKQEYSPEKPFHKLDDEFCKKHNTSAETVKKHIPAILDMVNEQDREIWISSCIRAGLNDYLRKYKRQRILKDLEES